MEKEEKIKALESEIAMCEYALKDMPRYVLRKELAEAELKRIKEENA